MTTPAASPSLAVVAERCPSKLDGRLQCDHRAGHTCRCRHGNFASWEDPTLRAAIPNRETTE